MSSFVFEAPSEPLRVYLTHLDLPRTSEGYWEVAKRLQAAVPEAELRRYELARKRWYCRDESAVEPAEIHTSGPYRLEITVHETEEGCWSYSKGRVFAGERLIAEILRNYSAFPFLFVEGHPNGHDYLLCGEDYQGQTVIELDTAARADYLPPEAAEGVGFCWAAYTASPSKQTLLVDGCFWACPYELWLLDLSQPMALPYPVLHKEELGDGFKAWLGPDECEVEVSELWCVPLEKRESALTDDEQAELDQRQKAGEQGLYQTRKWTVRLKREGEAVGRTEVAP